MLQTNRRLAAPFTDLRFEDIKIKRVLPCAIPQSGNRITSTWYSITAKCKVPCGSYKAFFWRLKNLLTKQIIFFIKLHLRNKKQPAGRQVQNV